MNSTKLGVALIFVAVLVFSLAGESLGYPPFLAKARKFGAKDCTFCHVDPLGGAPWNERGQWLIHEKDRRKVDSVDVEWLADYKPGKAADKKSPAPSTKIEQELTALYNELVEGAKKKDSAPFARILADDFSEITADGQVINKATILEGIPKYEVESYVISELAARAFGDTAVMTFRQSSKGKYEGQDIGGDYRETVVWAKRDGRWQMVASHASKVATR